MYIIFNSFIIFKQHNGTQKTLERLISNCHSQRQLKKASQEYTQDISLREHLFNQIFEGIT